MTEIVLIILISFIIVPVIAAAAELALRKHLEQMKFSTLCWAFVLFPLMGIFTMGISSVMGCVFFIAAAHRKGWGIKFSPALSFLVSAALSIMYEMITYVILIGGFFLLAAIFSDTAAYLLQ